MSSTTLNYRVHVDNYNLPGVRPLFSLASTFKNFYYSGFSPFIIKRYINQVNKSKIRTVISHLNITSYNNDVATQKYIEETLYHDFKEIFLSETSKKAVLINGINKDLLGPVLHKYIMDKTPYMLVYINKLKKVQNNSSKSEDLLYFEILDSIDVKFLYNLCLVTFLQVYTNQQTDNEKRVTLVPVIIALGKKMASFYINYKKDLYIKDTGQDRVLFSEFKSIWGEKNSNFIGLLEDDSFISKLGTRIIEILNTNNMVKNVLVKIPGKKDFKHYLLEVCDISLFNSRRPALFNLSMKLPMVCVPKKYTPEALGGYILNNVKYDESLFIEKKRHRDISLLDSNIIYNMVNKTSATPFKVNTELLAYINTYGIEQGLIMDPEHKHEFQSYDVLKPHQKKRLVSFNSKMNLQETILDIAEVFSKFPRFYFPVRLDVRGRLYCTSTYFNYQSTELAKSLLLFAEPSVIQKTDTTSIEFLLSYGVNCLGSKVSKQSLNKKLEWIENNKENIIDFKNGILISKAKDKLLFLAFCIEYKRYIEFLADENVMEFYTYLPIQLDATCNGFQHLALLSNETALWKELNLTSDNKNKDSIPGDFYSFLLHRLEDIFTKNMGSNHSLEKSGGSYERLAAFMWERSFIKKAVMTIPYNVGIKSMVKDIKDLLVPIESSKELTWFSDSEKNKKVCVNQKDIYLLATTLKRIVSHDFEKIKKLIKYLRNISNLLYHLNLPIVWTLPTGLTIKQSYLDVKSTTITPFIHSKVKINLQTTIKDKFDKQKQTRALMPNLIHSLDASSMSLLHKKFTDHYNDLAPFYSVHDCFGTTCDKVFVLKTMLASVYTDIYTTDQYLITFDKYILDFISNTTGIVIDRNTRIINLKKGDYKIHDVEWVINNKLLTATEVKKIDQQHIVV